MTKKLSWKPRRKDKIYCAPACGRGCTFAEYQRAQKDAKKLLAKMRGKGWKIRVHENLGWHYQVYYGGMNVYASGSGGRKYWVLFNTHDGIGAGDMRWSNSGHYSSDPNKAVAAVLRRAKKEAKKDLAAVESIEKMMLGKTPKPKPRKAKP